jgi:hypothetical protein
MTSTARTALARIALALAAPVLVSTAACDDPADRAAPSPREAMCRQLIQHILEITPRPGSDRPETDPARIRELAARVPIEDIDQCAAIKDPVKPGEPAPAEGQVPRVLACMQAAGDVAALKACIPAEVE